MLTRSFSPAIFEWEPPVGLRAWTSTRAGWRQLRGTGEIAKVLRRVIRIQWSDKHRDLLFENSTASPFSRSITPRAKSTR